MGIQSNQPVSKSLLVAIFLELIAIVLGSAVTGYAQDVWPLRGVQPSGSYLAGDVETIDTTQGTVMLHIPLAALPAGRGRHPGATLSLFYNSKLWRLLQTLNLYPLDNRRL